MVDLPGMPASYAPVERALIRAGIAALEPEEIRRRIAADVPVEIIRFYRDFAADTAVALRPGAQADTALDRTDFRLEQIQRCRVDRPVSTPLLSSDTTLSADRLSYVLSCGLVTGLLENPVDIPTARLSIAQRLSAVLAQHAPMFASGYLPAEIGTIATIHCLLNIEQPSPTTTEMLRAIRSRHFVDALRGGLRLALDQSTLAVYDRRGRLATVHEFGLDAGPRVLAARIKAGARRQLPVRAASMDWLMIPEANLRELSRDRRDQRIAVIQGALRRSAPPIGLDTYLEAAQQNLEEVRQHIRKEVSWRESARIDLPARFAWAGGVREGLRAMAMPQKTEDLVLPPYMSPDDRRRAYHTAGLLSTIGRHQRSGGLTAMLDDPDGVLWLARESGVPIPLRALACALVTPTTHRLQVGGAQRHAMESLHELWQAINQRDPTKVTAELVELRLNQQLDSKSADGWDHLTVLLRAADRRGKPSHLILLDAGVVPADSSKDRLGKVISAAGPMLRAYPDAALAIDWRSTPRATPSFVAGLAPYLPRQGRNAVSMICSPERATFIKRDRAVGLMLRSVIEYRAPDVAAEKKWAVGVNGRNMKRTHLAELRSEHLTETLLEVAAAAHRPIHRRAGVIAGRVIRGAAGGAKAIFGGSSGAEPRSIRRRT